MCGVVGIYSKDKDIAKELITVVTYYLRGVGEII